MEDPAFSRVFVVCGKAAEVARLPSHTTSHLCQHTAVAGLRGMSRRGVLHRTASPLLS